MDGNEGETAEYGAQQTEEKHTDTETLPFYEKIPHFSLGSEIVEDDQDGEDLPEEQLDVFADLVSKLQNRDQAAYNISV